MKVECPSGLTGTVRGLTVEVAGEMARQRRSDNATTNQILRRNWVETLDPGPYTLLDDGTIDWNRVLVADRFYVVMMVRVATYGPEFEFRVACEDCKRTINSRIDLLDLPLQPLLQSSVETFLDGNRFSTELRGTLVYFRLLDGAMEAKAQRGLNDAKNPLAVGLAHQIIEVDGVKNKTRWIRQLEMGDMLDLRAAFDEADGGIDTEVEVWCSECGLEQVIDLPFGRRDFWAPRRRKRKAV